MKSTNEKAKITVDKQSARCYTCEKEGEFCIAPYVNKKVFYLSCISKKSIDFYCDLLNFIANMHPYKMSKIRKNETFFGTIYLRNSVSKINVILCDFFLLRIEFVDKPICRKFINFINPFSGRAYFSKANWRDRKLFP